MKVLYRLDDQVRLAPSAIALGMFDGVHTAHQKVISSMVKYASENNLISVVYTFSNHPKEINHLIEPPKRLITPRQKESIMANLGVDVLVMVPFDINQLNITAQNFIEKVIVNQLNAKHITVGYDFRFGKNAKGSVQYIKDSAEKYKYAYNILEPIRHDGMVISSTRIRECLMSGHVRAANDLLGRNYCLQGTVIHGKHMGRKLGFPTINLKTDYEMTVLKPGVYITETFIGEEKFQSTTNVGFNPTFNQANFNIETYILDFNEDLYDQHVRIEFLDYIRPEIKFDNLDALIDKINEDVLIVKKYFNL